MIELWLPILISTTACLAIAAFAWGVLPFHSRQHRRLPTEPELLEALRKNMPAPGLYAFPYRGVRGANTTRADVVANLERGPVGYVVVGRIGSPRVVAPLVMHFLFFLLISILAAYIAILSGLKDGAPFIKVFQIVSVVSSMALVLGAVPLSIWLSRPWKIWMLQCADGLACGLATGAIFAWLWPA